MARRADVRTIKAPIDKVWAGLVLFEDDRHPIMEAVGSPGKVGSRIVYGREDRSEVHTVVESGDKHFIRYRVRFHGGSGALQHLAFTEATVEADYEIKAARDRDVTYIRAVAEYQPPLWPTVISLVFALLALVGLNSGSTANSWVMGTLVALWVAVAVAMQYLPKVFAYRFVTRPVLDKLEESARSGSFASSVSWRPPDDSMTLTGVLELRPMSKMTREDG